MTIPLTYGAFMAMTSALVTLLFYFLGYHSDPAKLASTQTLMMVTTIAVVVAGIVLGTLARRAQIPPSESFGYGRALGVGLLIGLFAALFGGAFNTLYTTAINPDFTDIILQQQTAKLEAMGMSSDEIEKASGLMRMMFNPAIQFGLAVFSGFIQATFASLIVAAFAKRPRSSVPPGLPTA